MLGHHYDLLRFSTPKSLQHRSSGIGRRGGWNACDRDVFLSFLPFFLAFRAQTQTSPSSNMFGGCPLLNPVRFLCLPRMRLTWKPKSTRNPERSAGVLQMSRPGGCPESLKSGQAPATDAPCGKAKTESSSKPWRRFARAESGGLSSRVWSSISDQFVQEPVCEDVLFHSCIIRRPALITADMASEMAHHFGLHGVRAFFGHEHA